ncbi:uncharacterized protein TRIADDRAFT_52980 [Trichoplax adhaerens]|uniref:BZIP domain-containing protein n=1 Tax=Trichoplax adhaerens TaxID=10228 RepID=B3RMZ4_TRIAD|nr:hypothetical protein TRIADDRAFT_52980 [Trichoplax adhaerens]EDV27364.1 hypothetical protein TRIADDRAFT_52980 [Trichoplax adhaerens]|eukprot:XP_002109198.1 hypothetical protein TRIADDRAFT_52980 [Trichoplax adhaerens]
MTDRNQQNCLSCSTLSPEYCFMHRMDVMSQKCLSINPLHNGQIYPTLKSNLYPTLPSHEGNMDNVRIVVGALDKKSANLSASKKSKTPVPNDRKDDKYWDKRKRNNESAKRSREARKLKDNQVASRATWLEEENVKIKAENAALREELACWRYYFSQPFSAQSNPKPISGIPLKPYLF